LGALFCAVISSSINEMMCSSSVYLREKSGFISLQNILMPPFSYHRSGGTHYEASVEVHILQHEDRKVATQPNNSLLMVTIKI
jgi:hypothetical protein